VKTRKLRSPIPIGRGFLIFRGPVYGFENIGGFVLKVWPAPGSADTELGVLMDLEVGHGETKIYAGVQA